MIIYIYGSDSYRSSQFLEHTVSEFKKKRDPQGYNVVVLTVNGNNGSQIITEINTSPFLADKRMIVIKNAMSSSDKDFLAKLKDIINEHQFPESNIIVFWQGEKLSRVKIAAETEKLLQKQSISREFSQLKGKQLETWINKQFKERGSGQPEVAVISYLVENVGHDMWYLHNLLDQLVAYKGKKAVKIEDISLFLEERVANDAFQMVEAMMSGDKKRAMKLLTEQRRLGEDDSKLFGLIAWQVKILLQMRDIYETEEIESSQLIARKLAIHPFVAKKNLYLVKKYSLAKIKDMHQQLLDIDNKTKTGLVSQSLAIDLFVSKI